MQVTRRNFLIGLGAIAVSVAAVSSYLSKWDQITPHSPEEVEKRTNYRNSLIQSPSYLSGMEIPSHLEPYRSFLISNPRIFNTMIWEDQPIANNPSGLKALFQILNDLSRGIIPDQIPQAQLLPSHIAKTSDVLKNEGFLEKDALQIYLTNIGHALYIEVNRLVPWSIRDYSDGALSLLFDSHFIFSKNGDIYEYFWPGAGTTDWNRPLYFRILNSRGMVKSTPAETLYAVMDWMRKYYRHNSEGESSLAFYRDNYGYQGMPPFEKLLDESRLHSIDGCPGMSAVLRASLHSLNIPVHEILINLSSSAYKTRFQLDYHSAALFPTIGLAMQTDSPFEVVFNDMPSHEIFFSIDDFMQRISNAPNQTEAAFRLAQHIYKKRIKYRDDRFLHLRALEILGRTSGSPLRDNLTGIQRGVSLHGKPILTSEEINSTVNKTDQLIKDMAPDGDTKKGAALYEARWKEIQILEDDNKPHPFVREYHY